MNPNDILKEGQRFVAQGIVYKVIRKRPNLKMTIKPLGAYTRQGRTFEPFEEKKGLTPEEKREEQEFFEEKGEENAKSNEGKSPERPTDKHAGDSGPGQKDCSPSGDGNDPGTKRSNEQS